MTHWSRWTWSSLVTFITLQHKAYRLDLKVYQACACSFYNKLNLPLDLGTQSHHLPEVQEHLSVLDHPFKERI